MCLSRPALHSHDYLDSAKRLKHRADDTVRTCLSVAVAVSVGSLDILSITYLLMLLPSVL